MARGFAQRQGVNYEETFAPVANLDSIRVILALAQYDLKLDQMDVATAYLNGVLNEEIYLSPPPGVDIKPGHCWRLKRSLYGLKQASRTWNRTLDTKLTSLGFHRLNAETCLYVYRSKGQVCYLVVYVDDLLLAASSKKFMKDIKQILHNTYKMKDLGPAEFILGIEIKQDRTNHKISMSQEQYVQTVLRRCGMAQLKPVSMPMIPNIKLLTDDSVDNSTMHHMTINGTNVSYASVVGSLMYGMMGTRPDIAFLVGVLGRYSANPKKCH